MVTVVLGVTVLVLGEEGVIDKSRGASIEDQLS